MAGLFNAIKTKVLVAVSGQAESVDAGETAVQSQIKGRCARGGARDEKIALGVLLWEVAQADEQFLPQERERIAQVLKTKGGVGSEDIGYVLEAARVASGERIDLYSFTQEVGGGLKRTAKIGIVEDLFRVACIDSDLAHEEEELIRKIAGLFHLDHQEFIEAKIKVKKEFGMDTAGL